MPIFAHQSLSATVQTARQAALDSVKRRTEIADVDSVAQEVFEKYRLPSASIRRADAHLEANPAPDGISIAIRIPIDGSTEPFRIQLRAAGPGQTTGISHVRVVEADRWADPSDEDNFTHLLLSDTLQNPTADQVRDWGRRLTDRIAQELDTVLKAIAAENEALKVLIETKVRERKTTLDAGKGLGDLGRGI